MKTIATHRAPDADALCAAWLARRFLFAEQESEVVFVSRSWSPQNRRQFDCAVDIGRTLDSARRIFDHKPPALPDRNQSCAALLVFKYLEATGEPVALLTPLIAVVHEGDRRPPLRASAALSQSRHNGFHALVTYGRRAAWSDERMYQTAEVWLDGYWLGLRQASVAPQVLEATA